jgi:hypothetical protein
MLGGDESEEYPGREEDSEDEVSGDEEGESEEGGDDDDDEDEQDKFDSLREETTDKLAGIMEKRIKQVKAVPVLGLANVSVALSDDHVMRGDHAMIRPCILKW